SVLCCDVRKGSCKSYASPFRANEERSAAELECPRQYPPAPDWLLSLPARSAVSTGFDKQVALDFSPAGQRGTLPAAILSTAPRAAPAPRARGADVPAGGALAGIASRVRVAARGAPRPASHAHGHGGNSPADPALSPIPSRHVRRLLSARRAGAAPAVRHHRP